MCYNSSQSFLVKFWTNKMSALNPPPVPISRQVTKIFRITPLYLIRRAGPLTQEALVSDITADLAERYGNRVVGPISIPDMFQGGVPRTSRSVPVSFTLMRSYDGAEEDESDVILLEGPPDVPDRGFTLTTPVIETGIQSVSYPPNPLNTANFGTLFTRDDVTTGEYLRATTSATISLDRRGEIQGSPRYRQIIPDSLLEALAEKLSISTEVSRYHDKLVVKTSLFLEREDTSLITVDSFEGDLYIDELR